MNFWSIIVLTIFPIIQNFRMLLHPLLQSFPQTVHSLLRSEGAAEERARSRSLHHLGPGIPSQSAEAVRTVDYVALSRFGVVGD